MNNFRADLADIPATNEAPTIAPAGTLSDLSYLSDLSNSKDVVSARAKARMCALAKQVL